MAASPSIRFGEFTFDAERRQLFGADGEIHLTPKAFDLLQTLLAERPKAVAKQDLLDRLWPDTAVGDASLTVLVAEIRRALDDNPREPRFVRTVQRIGYAFCADGTEPSIGQTPELVKKASRWCLVWNDRTFGLSEGENLVGRNPQSAVWLDSPGISRRHARILIAGDNATVEDLESTNHTYVRGKRITSQTAIGDEDAIRFGNGVEMRFRMWDVKTASLARKRSQE